MQVSSETVRASTTKKSFFEYSATDIDGSPVPLSNFKGKVVLVVNTASKCGYTPQYNELQAIFAKYQKHGFVVLGFPSNDFGAQEPGSDQEIKAFCDLKAGKYKVGFPLFSKSNVKSSPKNPIYKFLTEHSPNQFRGDVTWNFEKFLVDKEGNVVGRFKPSQKPNDSEIVKAIEKFLAK